MVSTKSLFLLFQNITADIYAISIRVSGGNTISFKGRFDSVGSSGTRQPVKIFGSDNYVAIDGMLTVSSDGTCIWSGEGNVTATMNSSGIVTVTLPNNAYDDFVLMSPYVISK